MSGVLKVQHDINLSRLVLCGGIKINKRSACLIAVASSIECETKQKANYVIQAVINEFANANLNFWTSKRWRSTWHGTSGLIERCAKIRLSLDRLQTVDSSGTCSCSCSQIHASCRCRMCRCIESTETFNLCSHRRMRVRGGQVSVTLPNYVNDDKSYELFFPWIT